MERARICSKPLIVHSQCARGSFAHQAMAISNTPFPWIRTSAAPPIALPPATARENRGEIHADDVPALREQPVQQASTLTPERKLSVIGKPGEQSKERNADPVGQYIG